MISFNHLVGNNEIKKSTRGAVLYRSHVLVAPQVLPWPKSRFMYSRDIHEIDPQCDHVISCDIHFDLHREVAMRRYHEWRRCLTEA